MTNLSVLDIDATLQQIFELQSAGCDIVRIALPNSQSVEAFAKVRAQTDMPLVADIHFDYRLAIGGIEAGADKIRINPGNVPQEHLDKVIDCAKAHNVAIRLGVNGGSVNKAYLDRFDGDKQLALVQSLRDYTTYFEQRNFDNLVLSVKSSDIRQTIALNKAIATLGYPLHLGVTEAGLLHQGLVKNAIGIAGANGGYILFKHGQVFKRIQGENPLQQFIEEVNKL